MREHPIMLLLTLIVFDIHLVEGNGILVRILTLNGLKVRVTYNLHDSAEVLEGHKHVSILVLVLSVLNKTFLDLVGY